MANRSALPYKLTVISKEKLAREATAPDPNLRRCVAHFRLHCGSVEWTEKDMNSRISSFDFEDTDEEDEKEEAEKESKEEQTPKSEFTTIDINDEPLSASETDATSPPSASPPPAPELSPENGLLDTNQDGLEMTSKNFWPSGDSCIAVQPISG